MSAAKTNLPLSRRGRFPNRDFKVSGDETLTMLVVSGGVEGGASALIVVVVVVDLEKF